MESDPFVPFENLDRLLLVEIRRRNMPVGVIPRLYEKARGERPLSYETGSALLGSPNAKVGIVTGLELAGHLPHGEIDGLVGSVVLGRALGRLGYECFIMTEGGAARVAEALIRALAAPRCYIVDVSGLTPADLAGFGERMEVGVAIEKIGVNRKGVTHTIEGRSYESGPAYADDFINRLKARGKLTLGYGDGGNEIGFGTIFEQARAIVPFGVACQCPCGDGIVTSTGTGILWPVNVSNFGAYGTVAAMAMQTGDLGLALTPEELLKALDVAVAAGALDGVTGLPVPGEDGIPAATAAAVIRLMQTIVEFAFREFSRPF